MLESNTLHLYIERNFNYNNKHYQVRETASEGRNDFYTDFYVFKQTAFGMLERKVGELDLSTAGTWHDPGPFSVDVKEDSGKTFLSIHFEDTSVYSKDTTLYRIKLED
jgi:hypothetical protein